MMAAEDISPAILDLAERHPDPQYYRNILAAILAQQLGVSLPTGLKYADRAMDAVLNQLLIEEG